MQPNRHEFNCQTNSIRKHINNVLLIGDINLTNALQNDLAPGCRIRTIKSNRYQDLVKSINNLPKSNCYIICFSFYNNVENEIISIINAINNKNRNGLINVAESIYSSNSYIRKVLLDLRMQDVRPIGLVRTSEQMVKSIFHCQPMLHRPLDASQMNSLLAHLSEFTPLQLKDQNTLAFTYNADMLRHRNAHNLPLYNVDTQKHSEVKPNFPPLRVGTPNLRQVNSQFPVNKSTSSKKVKSAMARSLPVENLLPQNVGSIINYLQ